MTNSLEESVQKIIDVSPTHVVLFTQGGGCAQFSAVVYNPPAWHYLLYPDLKEEERVMDYIITGSWSKKAADEAKLIGSGKAKVNVVVDARKHSADGKFDRIPPHEAWKFSTKPAFVYYCENETVDGVQFSSDPTSPAAFPHHLLPTSPNGEAPIPPIGDHSSSFLSRPIPNLAQHALLYAGAQKNVGPAGVTILIVRKDLLVDTTAAVQAGASPVPTTISYKVLADAGSLYNTPPMFSMYVCLPAIKYYLRNGGLEALRALNDAKQRKAYAALDEGTEAGVFEPEVERASRSLMNALKSPEVEKQFVDEGKKRGLRGFHGHRSVGGIRLSLYHAVTEEQVDIVVDFMRQFVDGIRKVS